MNNFRLREFFFFIKGTSGKKDWARFPLKMLLSGIYGSNSLALFKMVKSVAYKKKKNRLLEKLLNRKVPLHCLFFILIFQRFYQKMNLKIFIPSNVQFHKLYVVCTKFGEYCISCFSRIVISDSRVSVRTIFFFQSYKSS